MSDALNLSKLAKHFSDEQAARALLEEMRWGKNPTCPHCGGLNPYRLTPRKPGAKTRPGLWKCSQCRKQFTVTVGTVFEDSRIPLSKWLLAIHLLSASKKGMSAHQIHRMLGISYKAAWFMMHRLRYAMSVEPLAGKLRGTVEMDETYVGGKRKGRFGRPPAGDKTKSCVVALVERNGRARAFPMEKVTSENIHQAIAKHVDQLQSELMTDEAQVYGGDKIGRIPHYTVQHGRGEYVRGRHHTNTIEGFFSLFKRGIIGSFHHIGKGHLNRYADEFAFRYSHRKVSDGVRAGLIVQGAEGKRLTYEQPAAS